MALENKFGIKNSAELARKEERISKKKAVELFEMVCSRTLRRESFKRYVRFINIYLMISMTLQEKSEP